MSLKNRARNQTGKSMLSLATFYELTETVLGIHVKVEASATFTKSGLLNNTSGHSHSV